MFAKIMLRPLSLSLSSTFRPSTPFSSLKPSTVRLLSTSAATVDQTLTYGPSLYKGNQPSKIQLQPAVEQKSQEDEDLFVEESFTRFFDISALRVPTDRCFALENRLRGHLLNWPRIPNIARVSGDEIEEQFRDYLVPQSNSDSISADEDRLVTLNRRIYGKAEGDGEEELSPVLYRDKLAKSFNSRGYANFRNLAKLSRPKKGKKKEGVVAREIKTKEKKGNGRNEWFLVELVEDESGEEGEDLSGLLGDEFKGRKWRGSTRLLLLDERFADKSIEEMPEAIKVSVPTL